MSDENNTINYAKLVDDAMRNIAKNALKSIETHGIVGENHFLISFLTTHPHLQLSLRMKQKYPEEMTIILQHQFEQLKVGDTEFSVLISFDGIKEAVEVPYSALTSFIDPSTKFALQFNSELAKVDLGELVQRGAISSNHDRSPSSVNLASTTEKVLILDNFRKK